MYNINGKSLFRLNTEVLVEFSDGSTIGIRKILHQLAFLQQEDAEIDDVEAKDILYMNTLLRYNLFLDPDTLSDEEWAWTIRYLKEIKEAENKTDG